MKYEILFIVRPDLEEKAIKDTFKKMEKVLVDKKAKVLSSKELGQKELAYEIRKFNTGYYYLYVIEADATAEQEFNRVTRINEKILIRYFKLLRIKDQRFLNHWSFKFYILHFTFQIYLLTKYR